MLGSAPLINIFEEMKQYVRFGDLDEAALRALAPHAIAHFHRIADEFYARLAEHPAAHGVFSGPAQVERLKVSLHQWMELLVTGPWDAAYFAKRARIGRMHVKIALPQRYMFGAMNLIRIALTKVASDAFADDEPMRLRVVGAVAKILDLELAIMLETYAEAFVEKVQVLERGEKQLLEERLELSEARYEEIVEKAAALIVTCDVAGRILLFNRRCEELTGLGRNEVDGRRFLDLFAPTHDHSMLEARCVDALAGRRVPAFEGLVRRGDGVERRVRWHLTTLPGSPSPILCAMGLDVSEEHELGVRTRRAERLASLGTMAAGLAHEIRNPLNAAHLQLTLVQRRLARPSGANVSGALEAADLVAKEMKRLAGLVEEFLQFARPQPLRIGRIDLRATASGVLALLGPAAAAAGVELILEPGDGVVASLDDERIKQVLHNLLRNAIEAAGSGGQVRVVVALAGDEARLEVIDDGPGLPSPDTPIFEPFFTTKEGGTGLGLAIVHRIVNDHGGRIAVERRAGRTVFAFALPASS